MTKLPAWIALGQRLKVSGNLPDVDIILTFQDHFMGSLRYRYGSLFAVEVASTVGVARSLLSLHES